VPLEEILVVIGNYRELSLESAELSIHALRMAPEHLFRIDFVQEVEGYRSKL